MTGSTNESLPLSSRDDFELERYRGYLLFLARLHFPDRLRGKIGASDVVQQTFIEAHRHKGQFRGRTEKERTAWLRQILSNCMAQTMRGFRQAKRDLNREQPWGAGMDASSACLEKFVAANMSSPSRQAVKRENVLRVAEALAEIPDKQRQAVVMRFFHDKNFTEISQALDCSVTNAIKLIHRGMKRIRAAIEGEHSGETDV